MACRLRRVKCDNQRPFCRKCIDGGRECAGYERETVFIIGTIEDQGRCSSHPPRVVKPKKGKAARGGGETENFELVPNEPLRPAWDDLVSVSCRGRSYRLQVAALYTDLQGVTRAGADRSGDEADSRSVFVSLPPFDPPDVQPGMGEDDFQLGAQCLVHLATPDEEQGGSRQTAMDNICLFLYEHNTSSYFSNQPYWKDPSSQTNPVRRLGPEHFRSFPAHHFFARVYRPNAPHTLTRRLMAQDLLHNCLDLELDLGRWYAALSSSSSAAGQPQPHQQPPPPPFWLASNLPAHHTPFPHPLSFRDNPTALALTYHWTALVLFYPTIWRLYFAGVIDPTGLPQDPSTLPLPPRLQALDPMAYSLGKVREAAANACRGLDFFLLSTSSTSSTTTTTDQSGSNETWAHQQLDLLWHPLFVASRFYAELGGLGGLGDIADAEMGMEGSGVGGDGRLEMMWCEGCRQTLAARGRELWVLGVFGWWGRDGGRWDIPVMMGV
ncbi:hypothetical protein NEMBOFW57_000405 [Staphylotrichum longicolle]|uniref:Zn(2)-C6 fungal-type domain-containing protein n=1 Tax=Staphylotrichum longicolle TaxID=669026 RepID=A0AAD4F0D0_9PEZI|nr:hypothetical protein NEMBOFW57_000405 [Staphylotrichum longicolle]